MADTINWPMVRKWVDRENMATYWRPYGYPAVMQADRSMISGAEQMPRWSVPRQAIVSTAINGAFFSKQQNPHQALTAQEIIASAEDCIARGAQIIHVHARDERGFNILSTSAFRDVLAELRSRHPQVAFDACLVAVNDEECSELEKMLDAGLVDAVPVNTTAIILGDNLFVKPPHAIIEKTRLILDAGITPQIAVYTDADVDNARRLLIDSGLVRGPLTWLVVPALPGCSPMYDPQSMIDGFLRIVRLITHVDPGATILACSGGRASLYLANLALLMGLHVRVGSEDTIWKWPHRDDLITSNAEIFEIVRDMVASLGRELMSAGEFRSLLRGAGRDAARVAAAQ
ncbi:MULTISPECIES: 3-keto-5-aminohexanoate cleavage protein [unclassified Bradyrhizobium]|uniref:3-keto-5-aminohexanoate cleavage protein n=1 Tax=unclassified Bradyrhizobium TaxID=2631580 RepID=UPI0020128BA9|nr:MULTISPECIES: 3-keto-5-aminohexanoate cleavage protein [unclassified Bradyrhizobium]